jgi:hypothetical protein
MRVGGRRRPHPQRLTPNHDAVRPSTWLQAANPAPPPPHQAAAPAPSPPHHVATPRKPPRWMPSHRSFPLPTPASSSSTPVFIPGLHAVAAPLPTLAPPDFGGHSTFTSNGGGSPERGFPMAARRGATPFFNPGTGTGGSAAPAPPARAGSPLERDGGGKSEPGPHPHVGQCSPRRSGLAPPNGIHQEQGSSSTSGEYMPA